MQYVRPSLSHHDRKHTHIYGTYRYIFRKKALIYLVQNIGLIEKRLTRQGIGSYQRSGFNRKFSYNDRIGVKSRIDEETKLKIKYIKIKYIIIAFGITKQLRFDSL